MSFSIHRSFSLKKSIAQLSLSEESHKLDLNKESLDSLNDVYINLKDKPSLDFVNHVSNSNLEDQDNTTSEYCLEGDTTEKEKDLVRLNQLENKLFDTDQLTEASTNLIRAKILAIKKTYKLPIDYSDKLRMEDYIALQLTGYTLDEYESLTHDSRKKLILSLGGTQYLRNAYIRYELEGRNIIEPTFEQLRLRDQEDKIYHVLGQGNQL